MTQYTLIAYRENGNDYCRGCHMGSSDSDFGMEFTESLEHLKEMYTAYLNKDCDDSSDRAVMTWELTILVDGKDMYDEDEDLLEAIKHHARLASKQYATDKLLRKAESEIAERARAAERKRLSDLETLARLQAQYGGTK